MARPEIPRHLAFNPKLPLVVRRSFKANGRKFVPGVAFEPKDKAISVKKTKVLYMMGNLEHPEGATETPEEAHTPAPAAPVPTSPSALPGGPAPAVSPALPALDVLEDMSYKDLRALAIARGVDTKSSKQAQIEELFK